VPAALDLIAATGRLHSEGAAFTAAVGPSTVYSLSPWSRTLATATQESPPLAVASGATLSVNCQYQPTTLPNTSFGTNYWGNEQCTLWAWYSPASALSNRIIFCN
jgi:hypothetical protein